MNNLNSFFKNFQLKRRKEPFGWGASPDTDWKMIFLTTIFFIVLASALDLWLFLKINNLEVSSRTTISEETPAFDIEKLKATASYYQNKAVEFGRIQRGVSTSTSVVDPSL